MNSEQWYGGRQVVSPRRGASELAPWQRSSPWQDHHQTTVLDPFVSPATAGAMSHDTGEVSAQKTVLVADDNEDLRRLVRFELQLVPYHVIAVDNGTCALAAAEMYQPDLAVLDVAMGGLNGMDVCYRMRCTPETADIPILMLSARNTQVIIELAYALGANDYLTKPFRKSILLQRVRWLLEDAARHRHHE